MVVGGVFEFISLGAIIPFLYSISNVQNLSQSKFFTNFAKIFGLSSETSIISAFAFIFILSIFFSGVLRTFNLWFSSILSSSIGADLSKKSFHNELHQPYIVHINRNSSEILTLLVGCITRTILAIYSLLQISSNIFLIIFIVSALFIINWKASVIGFVIFSTSYLVIAILSKTKLNKNSSGIYYYSKKGTKAIQEGLGSIRDIILTENYHTFLNYFSNADTIQRKLSAENRFLNSYPRYVLESLGLGLIAFMGYIFVLNNGDNKLFIPTLGAVALGAQRLLPSMQQIYSCWAQMNGYKSDIITVLESLNKDIEITSNTKLKLFLRNQIILKEVDFSYGKEQSAISKLNLTIKRGESIGLVGKTGSGKSTTIDLIMGLLKPSSGNIYIDDFDLNKNNNFLSDWRKTIAHVPQFIYVIDGSFISNIAFGYSSQDINLSLVKRAAKDALIHDFIESTKKGYKSNAGEYGINLSGGQRQRLGIARTFYRIYTKHINLIVLDEATNALDSKTEKEILLTFSKMKDLTKIIISHNKNSLSFCNRIIELDANSNKIS